jgi:hypothetical protein
MVIGGFITDKWRQKELWDRQTNVMQRAQLKEGGKQKIGENENF